jgi:hypothetical protein
MIYHHQLQLNTFQNENMIELNNQHFCHTFIMNDVDNSFLNFEIDELLAQKQFCMGYTEIERLYSSLSRPKPHNVTGN